MLWLPWPCLCAHVEVTSNPVEEASGEAKQDRSEGTSSPKDRDAMDAADSEPSESTSTEQRQEEGTGKADVGVGLLVLWMVCCFCCTAAVVVIAATGFVHVSRSILPIAHFQSFIMVYIYYI